MTEETESIVLQILKSLQAGQRELKAGLARLESALGDLRVDVVRISRTQAYHEALFSRINDRLERIERELDRRDAARAATKEQQP